MDTFVELTYMDLLVSSSCSGPMRAGLRNFYRILIYIIYEVDYSVT